MPKPFLLVETPRAGDMNHRFICSPGADITGEAASGLCGDVRSRAGDHGTPICGEDYIAVIQRGVFQVRSDRRGDEIVILGGINPARIDVNAVAALLVARMPALGEIAAAVANRPGILVEHNDLRAWVEDAMAVRGARAARAAWGSGLPWKKVAVVAVAVAALGGLAVVAAPYVSALFAQKGDGGEPPPSQQPPSNIKLPGAQPIDDLAKKLGLPVADTRAGLGAWADDAAKVSSLAAQLDGDGGIDPLSLVKDAKSELRDAVVTAPLSRGDALKLRIALRGWRTHLGNLRTAARDAKLDVGFLKQLTPQQFDKLPTLALLAELAGGGDYAVFAAGTPEPKLPWLDDTDAATAVAMQKLFVGSAAGKAFARVYFGGRVPGELTAYLADLQRGAGAVTDKISAECRAAKSDHKLKVDDGNLLVPLSTFASAIDPKQSVLKWSRP